MNNFKSFHDYLTEAANGVVFTFGRFNPPTVGHEKLLEVLSKSAKGGDIQRLEEELSERLAAPVHLESRDGQSGRLVIGYSSLDELDGILSRIRK